MVDEDRIEATQNDIAKFFQRPQRPLQQMDESNEAEAEVEEGEQLPSPLQHRVRPTASEDKACCGLKLLLMSSIMAFSRLCGVTQYSYYMVDIMENTDVSSLVSAQWASAGVTIFEMVGKLPKCNIAAGAS